MKKYASQPSGTKYQQGTTLLEALIATVIISIGLLGVAGVQLYSVKASHSSHLRTYAINHAESLMDAMRASRRAALAGDFDDECDDGHTEASMPLSCTVRTRWDNDLVTLLGPDANATVAWDDRQVTLSIDWNDSRGESNNDLIARTTLVFSTEI